MSVLMIADDHWSGSDKYRLNDLKEFHLRRILETHGRRVDCIFHLGDQTDRHYFDAVLMERLSRIYLESLGRDVDKLYFVCGNHDSADRMITPFSTFVNGTKANGKGATVVGREALRVGSFLLRGWHSNNMELPDDDACYFVSHARVLEWVYGGEKAVSLSSLATLDFERIFLGDNHRACEVGKVVSIGCLFPSSHKDDDLEAGFVVFDEDHDMLERVRVTDYPVFKTLEITPDSPEPDEKQIRGNVIRLRFKGPANWANDAGVHQKWTRTVMAMTPHHVDPVEVEFERQRMTLPVVKTSLAEEVRMTANNQNWPAGALEAAIQEISWN